MAKANSRFLHWSLAPRTLLLGIIVHLLATTGFQVIQGLGVGMTQQMPSLLVQLALKDREDLLPVGIALNLFAQYLGATVTQVIAGVIFRSVLAQELTDRAGLNTTQIAQLSQAGTAHIRQVIDQSFPELLFPVLECYNKAMTSVFVGLRRWLSTFLKLNDRLVG